MVPSVFGMYRRCMHNSVIDLTWCLFCDFLTKNVIIQTLTWWHHKHQYNMILSSPVPALDRGADGLDGDEDEVAVLWVRVLVSDLFLLDMLPRRDAVQFVKVGVWIRTGAQVLIRLNLDIHKFWNVFMPYSKNFIGANSLLWSFVFQPILKGKKTMGVKTLSL